MGAQQGSQSIELHLKQYQSIYHPVFLQYFRMNKSREFIFFLDLVGPMNIAINKFIVGREDPCDLYINKELQYIL